MIQKKVCILGYFAVGKTSLVRRFVESIFDELYHTTVGVKVDKKVVEIGDQPVMLVLWDIHGEDRFQRIRASYLRGTSGFLLVADGTRLDTFQRAAAIHDFVQETLGGSVPFVFLVNKADLRDRWQVGDTDLDSVRSRGWEVLLTSAKTGERVEAAFTSLARRLLEQR